MTCWRHSRTAGAKLACLCSSDEVYAREAVAAAKALAAAGVHVYLAGRPGEREQALRAAGDRPISSSPVAMRSPRCGPLTASLPADRKAIRLMSSSAFPSP